MIRKLEPTDKTVASLIHRVFQSSYAVEAELIGVSDFPPLARCIEDISGSATDFYGYFEQDTLAAVIEVGLENEHLDIHSLTVAPEFFRRGIAGKLIDHVLNHFDYEIATVETAVVNAPAIRLYNKHGFVEFKRWTPAHGIEKLALSLDVNL